MKRILFVAVASIAMSVARAGTLPAGYEEVEYIDSDGREYVDLGFTVESGHRYLLTVAAINVSADVKMFGAVNGSTKGVFIGTINSAWRVGENLTSYSTGNYEVGGAIHGQYIPAIHDIRVAGNDPNYTSGVYFYNNTTTTLLSGKAEPESERNVCLFGYASGNGTTVYPGTMRFYSLKVYNASGDLIHDYVPVLDSGAVPGVYDLEASENAFLMATVKTEGGVLTVGPKLSDREIKNTRTSATYRTLEAAVDAAEAGDVITLKPFTGTYRLTSPRLVIDKAITLRGTGTSPADVVITPMANYNMFHIQLNHADARLENVTITGGWSGHYNEAISGDGQLRIDAGTASNCLVRGNTGRMWYGPVRLNGGVMTDSIVENNSNNGQGNSNAGMGGGVAVTGGTLTNCIVRNNSTRNSGGGVLCGTVGSLVVDCVISNNVGGTEYGCGVYLAGGTVERCLITDNHAGNTKGGGVGMISAIGVWNSGGKAVLRNCVIARNRLDTTGAGVYLNHSNGFVENCTIVDNTSNSAEGGGVYQKTGTIRNTVVARNRGSNTASDIANNLLRDGGTMINCVTENAIPAKGTLTDNAVGPCAFVDLPGGDYRPAVGSASIDAGLTLADFSNDFARVDRPIGTAWDAGAYEFDAGGLSAAIVMDGGYSYGSGTDITLRAVTAGSAAENLTYSWDFNGDGVEDATGEEVVWTGAGFGIFRPVVTVGNGSVTVKAKSDEEVEVLPSTVYVSKNGSNTPPYETAGKAASDVQAAIDAVYGTDAAPGRVIVDEGTYDVADFWLTVTKPVIIEGRGPNRTVFCAGNGSLPYKRVMLLNHDKAVVSGVGMTGGTLSDGSGYGRYTADDAGPGGIRIIAGTVTNCWIYGNIGSHNSGGVDMRGGRMVDSQIFRNTAQRDNNASVGNGGGVKITAGWIENCVISNNCAYGAVFTHTQRTGAGVYQTGGTVVGCLIKDNYGGGEGGRAGAGVALEGGLMDRCEITGNYNAQYGGGVYSYSGSGILRNCYIHHNTALDYGGGVCIYRNNNTAINTIVENCTIVNNTSKNSHGGGLYLAGGTVRNSIVSDNGDPAQDANCNIEYVKGTFEHNIYAPDKSIGTGNLVVAPGFRNAAAGDYSLGTGSPAIDAAYDYGSSVTNDFAGAARPTQGSLASAGAINDIGAWEALGVDQGDFRVAIGVSEPSSGLDELTVTYTASVAGHGMLGEITYNWNYPNGEYVSGEGSTVTVRYTTYGHHDVSLTAVNSFNEQATDTLQKAVSVGTKKAYVDLEGSSVWPYATKATAATNILDAVDTLVLVDGEISEIVVGDGEYKINDFWARITAPIYLHSEHGASATTLKANGPNSNYRRVINVNNADAVVDGFTMTGGKCYNVSYDGAGPGALRLQAGVVRNCIIRDNTGADNSGGVDMRGGTLENCVVSGNIARRFNNSSVGQAGGIAIYGNDAKVLGCTIADNRAGCRGGGIYVDANKTGVVVSNCVFRGNSNGEYDSNNGVETGWNGAAIYAKAGLFTDCVITGNVGKAFMKDITNHGYGEGTVYLTGNATLRNSLVADNKCCRGAQGVLMDSANATVLNCTIANNGDTNTFYKETATLAANRFTAGSVYNTILWDAKWDLGDSIGGSVTVSHNLVGTDPHFKGTGRLPYATRYVSPAVNAGDNALWGDGLDTATDLDGRPRKVVGVVDAGCYENPQKGTMLIIR